MQKEIVEDYMERKGFSLKSRGVRYLIDILMLAETEVPGTPTRALCEKLSDTYNITSVSIERAIRYSIIRQYPNLTTNQFIEEAISEVKNIAMLSQKEVEREAIKEYIDLQIEPMTFTNTLISKCLNSNLCIHGSLEVYVAPRVYKSDPLFPIYQFGIQDMKGNYAVLFTQPAVEIFSEANISQRKLYINICVWVVSEIYAALRWNEGYVLFRDEVNRPGFFGADEPPRKYIVASDKRMI